MCGFASVFIAAYFALTYYSREEVRELLKKFSAPSLDCERLSLPSFYVDMETFQIQRCISYQQDLGTIVTFLNHMDAFVFSSFSVVLPEHMDV
jgi:hypothetical protein